MNGKPNRGISRQGLGASFDAEETRKSNLLLEAQFLLAQQQHDEAAAKFAEAAEIEEHLSDIREAQGLKEKAWVHRFSAVGCWAGAGNIHEAITLSAELLVQTDLPERLRQRVHD